MSHDEGKTRIEFTPAEIQTMLALTLDKIKNMTEADPRDCSLLSVLLKLSRAELRLKAPPEAVGSK